MSVTQLRLDDFTSPVQEDTGGFYTLTSITAGETLNLDPTSTYSLSIAVTGLATTTSPTILIQDKPSSVQASIGSQVTLTHAISLNNELPPIFDITGFAQGAYITGQLTAGQDRKGTGRLKVLALLPNPRFASAILGQAILGSFLLPDTDSAPDWFTLGKSSLGQARLPENITFYYWRDIGSKAISVNIERGIIHNGINGQGDIGTLTAELYNPDNPRAIGLIRGTPIRAIDTVTRTRLFTGYLDVPPAQRREPNGAHWYSLNAVDSMATLAAIKRWQLSPPSGSASIQWLDVLDELLTKHGINWRLAVPFSNSLALGATAIEGNLTTYLDMYLGTAAVTWWVDRNSIVVAAQSLPTEPQATITDRAPADITLPVLHHVAETIEFDPALVITGLELRNHSVTQDPESGERTATQSEISIRANELAATYGEQSASFDTAALRPSDLTVFMRNRLREYQPRQVISSARFTPHKGYRSDDDQLTILTSFDLFDAVESRMLGETALAHITRIAHKITPNSWQTTLHFTESRD